MNRFYDGFYTGFRDFISELLVVRQDPALTAAVAVTMGLDLLGISLPAGGHRLHTTKTLIDNICEDVDDGELERQKQVIIQARRTYNELVALVDDHPKKAKREIDILFDSLVEG